MQEPTEEALPPSAKDGEVSAPIQQTVTAVLSKVGNPLLNISFSLSTPNPYSVDCHRPSSGE